MNKEQIMAGLWKIRGDCLDMIRELQKDIKKEEKDNEKE